MPVESDDRVERLCGDVGGVTAIGTTKYVDHVTSANGFVEAQILVAELLEEGGHRVRL